MFVDLAMAARIDRAEASLCSGINPSAGGSNTGRSLVLPLAGGKAVFIARGSPINKAIGIGFDGTLDPGELEAVETAWRERNEPVRIELCSLTDPRIAQHLSKNGYQLQGFENVSGRRLEMISAVERPDISISAVVDEHDLRLWKEISVTAFISMDGTGSVVDDPLERAEMEKVMTEMTSAPGFRRYVARMDGSGVGAASFRIDSIPCSSLAQMCGAGTLTAARGRGVQKALLHRRLLDARNAGCHLAVVTTAPGSRSQENMMRQGFSLLYSRAVMVKSWA
jgi:hypothetical protein